MKLIADRVAIIHYTFDSDNDNWIYKHEEKTSIEIIILITITNGQQWREKTKENQLTKQQQWTY